MKNDIVDATVEIPFRSRNKYEIDKKTGKIRLDCVLYSAMGYSTEYGTIENTLAPDGDPLDILIFNYRTNIYRLHNTSTYSWIFKNGR